MINNYLRRKKKLNLELNQPAHKSIKQTEKKNMSKTSLAEVIKEIHGWCTSTEDVKMGHEHEYGLLPVVFSQRPWNSDVNEAVFFLNP